MERLRNIVIVVCCLTIQTVTNVYAQPTTVAMIGDLQRTGFIEFFREDNEAEREALMNKLTSECVQAAVLLGDLTFWGASSSEWKYFDRLIQPLCNYEVQLFPVMGNHEYFLDFDITMGNLNQRFPWFKQTWYSQVIDSVGYIILNSNTENLGQAAMREQYGWYLRTIRNMEAADSIHFVVVCSHHPPYTNSELVEPEETLEKYFVKEFVRLKKSSFWFSGHCHSYERFVINDKQFVVSGGGGGPRQHLLCGDDAIFKDEYACDAIRDFHYCLLQRNGSILTMRMVPLNQSGTVLSDAVSVKGS